MGENGGELRGQNWLLAVRNLMGFAGGMTIDDDVFDNDEINNKNKWEGFLMGNPGISNCLGGLIKDQQWRWLHTN